MYIVFDKNKVIISLQTQLYSSFMSLTKIVLDSLAFHCTCLLPTVLAIIQQSKNQYASQLAGS